MGQKLDSPILETGVKTRNSFARALNNIAIENSLAEGESKRALRSSGRFNPQTENKENNAHDRTLKLIKQEKESIDVVSTIKPSKAANEIPKTTNDSTQNLTPRLNKQTNNETQCSEVKKKRDQNRDGDREYSLPFGWKKIGFMRQKTEKSSGKRHWDFYVYSPSGQKFRSTKEVTKYLKSNPDVKCDPEVTHCQRPKDLNQSLSEKATFSKRAPKRSSLKLNLQNEDKENTAPGRVLKVKKNQVVETKTRQKLIKNAIKKHGGTTGNQKPEKETEETTLNARGKPSRRSIRRNYVEVINISINFHKKYKKMLIG